MMQRTSALFAFATTVMLGCSTSGSPEEETGKQDRSDEAPLEIYERKIALSRSHLLSWPEARGGAPGVADRINATLSFEASTNRSVEMATTEWLTEGVGYSTSAFRTHDNVAGLLSVENHFVFIGDDAIASESTEFLTYDPNEGRVLSITDLITEHGITDVMAKLDVEIQRAIQGAIERGAAPSSFVRCKAERDQMNNFTIEGSSVVFFYGCGLFAQRLYDPRVALPVPITELEVVAGGPLD